MAKTLTVTEANTGIGHVAKLLARGRVASLPVVAIQQHIAVFVGVVEHV